MTNRASSGNDSFDEIVQGLRLGDNVVWQVDAVETYREYADAFASRAVKEKKNVIYMHFARHASLVTVPGVKLVQLDASGGFESLSRQVHSVITQQGRGAYYVFDPLSDLLSAWATDLMIGNFFRVTCPYLFELDTIAYFAVLRNSHSNRTIARIRETTQLLIDVYNHEGRRYVHPLKVWNRYSPTMFLPHLQEEDRLVPLRNSIDSSKLFEYIHRNIDGGMRRTLDYWDYLFFKAEELVRERRPDSEQREMVDHICRMMMTGEPKMAALIRRYFSLQDFLSLRPRVIGTGSIGGKSVGMLLARNILAQDQSFEADRHLEPHDSYFIGSDVFYTYIVHNGWWKLWMEQKTDEGYFRVASALREHLLSGKFPEEMCEQFYRLIDYFGQSAIIVRSSSLLEDAYGNAFAGKYESIFLANQGDPDERYGRLLDAVRRVYASTMNDDALVYRRRRGLDQKDEQMALLIQRVSGAQHGSYFFPFCAGVGMSHNTYVWQKDMDQTAGVLRLVFGLGTRAVNRVEGDYPRIAALDMPKAQPLAGLNDVQQFSQHEVDVIDLKENALKTVALQEAIQSAPDLPLPLVAVRAPDTPGDTRILTFDGLFDQTSFAGLMRRMLVLLEKVYRYPVDVEFTLNTMRDGSFRINLVQCRPIQAKVIGRQPLLTRDMKDRKAVIRSDGNFIGGNVSIPLRRIIYVDPRAYAALPQRERYEVARCIGHLNRQIEDRERTPALLIGPGRWGTTTPSLGIPVNFFEINNVAALFELEFSDANLTPEISYGSHFFHDLIETGIFYAALFQRPEVFFDTTWFGALTNRFNELLPGKEKCSAVITVCDLDRDLLLVSDIVTQKLTCYLADR